MSLIYGTKSRRKMIVQLARNRNRDLFMYSYDFKLFKDIDKGVWYLGRSRKPLVQIPRRYDRFPNIRWEDQEPTLMELSLNPSDENIFKNNHVASTI